MDVNIRRGNDLLCGRLVAMPSNSTMQQLAAAQQNQGLVNVISIDFPAMPDTIELARSADYAVNYNIVLPDGIHQYKGTKPLEIPVSFKLHFMDHQYCKQGALTLLQLGARLHSFILPISTYSNNVVIAPVASSTATTGQPTAAQQEANASQAQVYQVSPVSGKGQIYSPVTCWLHLMWVGENQPGISCIGYIKDVRVVFCGPWNRGPNNSFNLPTSAEYSFVFVHRPGHGNAMPFSSSDNPVTVATTPQAFADDIKRSLYNTQNLVASANYQGFGTGDFTQ